MLSSSLPLSFSSSLFPPFFFSFFLLLLPSFLPFSLSFFLVVNVSYKPKPTHTFELVISEYSHEKLRYRSFCYSLINLSWSLSFTGYWRNQDRWKKGVFLLQRVQPIGLYSLNKGSISTQLGQSKEGKPEGYMELCSIFPSMDFRHWSIKFIINHTLSVAN